jgi:hypothetical protein
MRWDGAARSRTYFLQRLVELRSITAATDKAAWHDWIHRKRSSEECFCLGFATSISAGGVALLIIALSSADMGGNAPWSISKANAASAAAVFSNEPGPVYATDLTSPRDADHYSTQEHNCSPCSNARCDLSRASGVVEISFIRRRSPLVGNSRLPAPPRLRTSAGGGTVHLQRAFSE